MEEQKMNNTKKKSFNAIDFFGKFGILIILILMIIAFAFANKNFLTFENAGNILRQTAIKGFICVGMAMVIITGGIDLSVGSTAGICSCFMAYLLIWNVPYAAALAIVLVGGLAIGFLNGFFINGLGLPPFIATLGTMTSLRGLAYVVTQAKPVTGYDKAFDWIGKANIEIGPVIIPFSAVIMITLFVIGWLFLEKTRFGTYIYGVGGNEEATRLSGVNPKGMKYTVYAINGFLAALAGIVLMARTAGGQPKGGDGYEMEVITSVVLGGVSMSGGEGKIGFVLIGVFFMGVLSNGMVMMNVNDYWQQVIRGLVLVAAVAFDMFMQKAKAKQINS